MTTDIRHARTASSLLAAAAIVAALSLTGCSGDALTPPLIERPLLEPSTSRAAPAFDFTTIDVAGATSTSPQGINASGDIVGSYVAGGVTRGFLLKNGSVETIEVPGAGFTVAHGIGPGGEIVGNYRAPNAASVVSFGFLRRKDGKFDELSFPGKRHLIPQRILADGTVLGCAHDNDLMASMVGMRIGSKGSDAISTFASMHNGATPDERRIIGLYTNMDAGNRGEGYYIDNGVFTPFLVPGSTSTAAWDVSANGDIVGVFQNASGAHGFLLSASGYTTIDFPGATATRAFGINARGDVVGNYVLGGVTHGFLARRL
jgi:uncharacterized membrane protein